MGAAVRIEASVWTDPRFDRLARALGCDRDCAVGRMARLWSLCTEMGTYVLEAMDVAVCLRCDDDDVERILCDKANLGVAAPEGIRVRGTKGRVEWLHDLRERAAAGGRARQHAAIRDEHGQFVSNPTTIQPKSPSGPGHVAVADATPMLFGEQSYKRPAQHQPEPSQASSPTPARRPAQHQPEPSPTATATALLREANASHGGSEVSDRVLADGYQFGFDLRESREAHGLSREDLEVLAGIKPGTLATTEPVGRGQWRKPKRPVAPQERVQIEAALTKHAQLEDNAVELARYWRTQMSKARGESRARQPLQWEQQHMTKWATTLRKLAKREEIAADGGLDEVARGLKWLYENPAGDHLARACDSPRWLVSNWARVSAERKNPRRRGPPPKADIPARRRKIL